MDFLIRKELAFLKEMEMIQCIDLKIFQKINKFVKKITFPPSISNYNPKNETTLASEQIKNYEIYILRDKLYRWLPSIIKAQKRILDEKKKKHVKNTEIDANQVFGDMPSTVLKFLDLNYEKDNYGKSYSLPIGETDDFSFSSISDIYTIPDDIMSSLDLPIDVSSILGDDYASDLSGFSLFQSAGSSAGGGFTMGGGIEIPLDFQINVTGTEKLDSLNQAVTEASDSIVQVDERTTSATGAIIEQYQNLTAEQVSLNTAISALNFSGIGMPFINISAYVEDADKNAVTFSDTLSDVARYAEQIGRAFMGVDEEIGKAIGSAGTLTEGVAGIFKAFEGDKVKGLGLMQGIQGGFAGLQGLFGGEPGSDMSELLGGMGGLGAGIAELPTERAQVYVHS